MSCLKVCFWNLWTVPVILSMTSLIFNIINNSSYSKLLIRKLVEISRRLFNSDTSLKIITTHKVSIVYGRYDLNNNAPSACNTAHFRSIVITITLLFEIFTIVSWATNVSYRLTLDLMSNFVKMSQFLTFCFNVLIVQETGTTPFHICCFSVLILAMVYCDGELNIVHFYFIYSTLFICFWIHVSLFS